MKKNLLSSNEDFDYELDYIYKNQDFDMCPHSTIAFDSRDDKFKCINCFTILAFKEQKWVEEFKHRIINDFNFEKLEITLRKKIKKLKFGEEDE